MEMLPAARMEVERLFPMGSAGFGGTRLKSPVCCWVKRTGEQDSAGWGRVNPAGRSNMGFLRNALQQICDKRGEKWHLDPWKGLSKWQTKYTL